MERKKRSFRRFFIAAATEAKDTLGQAVCRCWTGLHGQNVKKPNVAAVRVVIRIAAKVM